MLFVRLLSTPTLLIRMDRTVVCKEALSLSNQRLQLLASLGVQRSNSMQLGST